MAKLTNTPAAPAALMTPAAPAPTPVVPMAHGQVTQAGPRPFAVLPPSQAKSNKAPKKASAVAKTPRLSGTAWFDENFSGLVSDIVQIRKYPSRREGFHCPPCGIAGSNGIVIKGKDGKGEAIIIYKQNPTTRELEADGEITGFIVGETCLRKYGHVDIRKITVPA